MWGSFAAHRILLGGDGGISRLGSWKRENILWLYRERADDGFIITAFVTTITDRFSGRPSMAIVDIQRYLKLIPAIESVRRNTRYGSRMMPGGHAVREL